MYRQSAFGALSDGRPAQLFTLDNGLLTLSVTDYGATAVRLTVPDRGGAPTDVLLGYDSAAAYERDDKYLGRNGRPLRQPHRRRRVHARREAVRAYGQRRRQPICTAAARASTPSCGRPRRCPTAPSPSPCVRRTATRATPRIWTRA